MHSSSSFDSIHRASKHLVGSQIGRLCTVCLFLFICCALSAFGCSGCDSTQDGPCPETPCGVTEQCVQGQCISVFDVVCVPSCGDDQVCNQGTCIDVVDTCTAARQVCDPFKPVSGEYFCIDWDGLTAGDPATCANPCAQDGTCSEGEACFVLSGLNETSCQSQSDCGVGRLCLDGSCRAAACRPSECEGTIKGAQSCKRKYAENPQFPNGATCYESGEDINQCVPAGLQSINEVCISIEDATSSGQFTFTCKLGLSCVQGRCLTPCEDDSPCGEGKTCLFAEESIVGNNVGFCGISCEPFQTGVCEGQNKCLPVRSDLGYCVPAGEIKAFDSCAPNTFGCEDGTWCVSYENGASRCMPFCNVGVAPPEGETTVTLADQLKRDATCPQPDDPAQAYTRIQHLATGAGAVDIYIDRSRQPVVAGLQPGSTAVSADVPGFLTLSPGAHVLEVRPAGAPVIDAPVVELSFALSKDQAVALVLGDSRADQADAALGFALTLDVNNPPGLRILQAVADMPAIDVVAYPEASASTLTGGIVLGRGVTYKTLTETSTLAKGRYDVYLWPAENARQDPNDALWIISGQTLGDAIREELALVGTRSQIDALSLSALLTTPEPVPEAKLGPPPLTCTDLNNGVFGFCEQICDGPKAYAANVCSGGQMGCLPIERPGFLGWESLCRPTGAKMTGQSCNPRVPFGECADGLYCLEYGNAAVDFSPAERGRCLPHCVVGDDANEALSCEDGQSCQILAANFDIGRCGYSCEPNANYTDASCPEGLGSCKPLASATRESGGTGAPSVEDLPPFCSASGVIAQGESCGGADCVPGTECLYPRSTQNTLVSTLLSSYFGSAGQTPTCVPQCDPFDAVLSNVRCGVEETCLVNFPWSANVGHCADIVERAQPFQSCTRPGEACGDDSVCVVDGGAPFCLRLCQYVGGPSVDVYSRSTCPIGYQCRPLVNDVGFCQAG